MYSNPPPKGRQMWKGGGTTSAEGGYGGHGGNLDGSWGLMSLGHGGMICAWAYGCMSVWSWVDPRY